MVVLLDQVLGATASSGVIFDKDAWDVRYEHGPVKGHDGSVLKQRVGEP